jgi:hypothetical protein
VKYKILSLDFDVQREMSKEVLKIAAFYYFSSPLTMWGEKRKPQENDLVAAKSPNYFHKSSPAAALLLLY